MAASFPYLRRATNAGAEAKKTTTTTDRCHLLSYLEPIAFHEGVVPESESSPPTPRETSRDVEKEKGRLLLLTQA